MGVKRAGGKRKLVPKEPAEATTEDGADTDGRRSRNVAVETKTTQKHRELQEFLSSGDRCRGGHPHGPRPQAASPQRCGSSHERCSAKIKLPQYLITFLFFVFLFLFPPQQVPLFLCGGPSITTDSRVSMHRLTPCMRDSRCRRPTPARSHRMLSRLLSEIGHKTF